MRFMLLGFMFAAAAHWAAAEDFPSDPRLMTNGVDAEVEDYPFAIVVRTDAGFCSGTLIRPTWALTAAHCLFSSGLDYAPRTGVRVGYDCNPARSACEAWRNAVRVLIHPSYRHAGWVTNDATPWPWRHDIALIQLTRPFSAAGPYPRLGRIGQTPHSGIARQATWLSYGPTSRSGSQPTTLRRKTVWLEGTGYCDVRDLPSDMVCVNDRGSWFGRRAGSNTRSIPGDSGSGVIAYYQRGVPTIVGVLSMSNDQSEYDWFFFTTGGSSVSGFVRVSARRGWIQSKMREYGY